MITAASASNATLSHCLALFAIAWEDFFFLGDLHFYWARRKKKIRTGHDLHVTYRLSVSVAKAEYSSAFRSCRVVKSEAIRSGSVAFSALLEKIQGNLAKFYDTKEKLPGNEAGTCITTWHSR